MKKNKKRGLNYYRQTKDSFYKNRQQKIPVKCDVDFVNEVEEFNATFGKPNNYKPTIPAKKEW